MQSAVWMEQSRFVDGVKTLRPAPPTAHTHRYFHIQTATLHRPLRFPFVGRKGRALMQMGQSNHSLDVPRAVEYAMPSPSLLPPLYISCRVANGMYVPHLILYFFLLPTVLHSPTSSQQSKKLFTDGHGQRKRCARTWLLLYAQLLCLRALFMTAQDQRQESSKKKKKDLRKINHKKITKKRDSSTLGSSLLPGTKNILFATHK